MTTRPLLQLFDRALADHARNVESGELRVITFVAPDVTRDPHLSLLREVTLHAGGLFIVAAEQWHGVTARGDSAVESVVCALGEPRLVELERDGDQIAARHPDGPDPETNDAAKTFLGLVNSLLDGRLQEFELAVVAYDEAELDNDRMQAAWGLVTGQLRDLSLGSIRTLVVLVAAAEIDYRRHCGRDRGVRFAIQAGELSERRDWRNNKADIARLANTTEPLVLFLAAGASASSGMPIGDRMRDAAIRRLLGDDDIPDEELAARFYEYSREVGQLLPGESAMTLEAFRRDLTLERVLYLEQQAVSGTNYGPTMLDFTRRHEVALERRGPAVRAVHEMIALQKRLVLVTVNLDELVEHEHEEQLEIFAADDEFAACAEYLADYLANGGRVPLLKLHGTVSKPESVVVSVDRVAAGLTEDHVAALSELHGTPECPRSWIYVGSSMRDRDLRTPLGMRGFANDFDEWWVTPFRVPTVDQFINELRTQPWKLAGRYSTPLERTITETADVFLTEFAQLWTAKNE